MTKAEYVDKMRQLGWNDEYIQEQIEIREEAEKNGINIPYEIDMIEAPKE